MAPIGPDMDSNTTYLSTIVNHYIRNEVSAKINLKDLKKITLRLYEIALVKDSELLKYNLSGIGRDFLDSKPGNPSGLKHFMPRRGISFQIIKRTKKIGKWQRHL